MEFGLFNQMYHPVHRRGERNEHECLMDELAIIEVADRVGFKYAWASEHHFLDEYSHLSASEAFMAYALARTKNIHIGSGIINITPPVSPPSRVAEKVAMLDHLGQGRFEWGTGRGSSSTEVHGFGIETMDETRDMYDETLPEIIKMMQPGEYGPFDGTFFSMPRRNVLPKPYTNPHPPIWVAAGSPGTFEKAARLGLGVLCFTMGTPDTLAPLIEVYKKNIEKAEPIGGYINNNIMVTTDMMVLEDGARARQISLNNRGNYHTALLFKYLDSFPISDGQPKWPEIPAAPQASGLEYAIRKGIVAVGTPDEAINTLKRYEAIGADQIAFGTFSTDVSLADATEAYETFGTHVLPEFDKDPIHSTTRQRDAQLGALPSGVAV
jgi:alkanesulfonate monooxygenase SsuD/methylene tetrahydromethanopterin reductase-like flavin-dependent oxidoreductase (luciferase family)